jgi:hypothetical protein
MTEKVPNPGQIWRENDGRFQRHVRVLAVEGERVKIITVDPDTRTPAKGARTTTANLFRFGGCARGKYSFVEEPRGPSRSVQL